MHTVSGKAVSLCICGLMKDIRFGWNYHYGKERWGIVVDFFSGLSASYFVRSHDIRRLT